MRGVCVGSAVGEAVAIGGQFARAAATPEMISETSTCPSPLRSAAGHSDTDAVPSAMRTETTRSLMVTRLAPLQSQGHVAPEDAARAATSPSSMASATARDAAAWRERPQTVRGEEALVAGTTGRVL